MSPPACLARRRDERANFGLVVRRDLPDERDRAGKSERAFVDFDSAGIDDVVGADPAIVGPAALYEKTGVVDVEVSWGAVDAGLVDNVVAVMSKRF